MAAQRNAAADTTQAAVPRRSTMAFDERTIAVHPHLSVTSSVAHWEVSTAPADPPPRAPRPHGSRGDWQRFEHYPNYLAACIVAGLLENEGVPAVIESSGIFPDTESSAIWVPGELMHRARWILAL